MVQEIGHPTSKLLIPLSYAAGMGGPMAAIATPTALLLSDMYEYKSGQPLSIFTSTLPALVCLAVAMSVIIIFRRLLPDTNNPESALRIPASTPWKCWSHRTIVILARPSANWG